VVGLPTLLSPPNQPDKAIMQQPAVSEKSQK